MTKLMDDLEIYDRTLVKEQNSNVVGQYDFCCIVDEEEGNSFREGHVILVDSRLTDESMVNTVCHELEHYDIAKSLLTNGILTEEQLLDWVKRDGVITKRALPEWAHSNPSYLPSAR